jgi:hypothetical protein
VAYFGLPANEGVEGKGFGKKLWNLNPVIGITEDSLM